MKSEHKKVKAYWNRNEVESMYDKYLLNAEIGLIKRHIPKNAKILDAGCGEAETTLVYSRLPGVKIHAVDFSTTRLKKAKLRLKSRKNVTLKQVDFLGKYRLDNDYDLIISQRFLINLLKWNLQKKVLLDLVGMLKKGGKLIMLEGSKDGVDALNACRRNFKLAPIPVKWHNLFFKDKPLIDFMQAHACRLIEEDGLSAYFFLTRAVRPLVDKELEWDCFFNKISASSSIKDILNLDNKLSRLKLWVFKKYKK